MSVRRHAARLAMVGVMLGGLGAVGASPALADGDRVELRAADSFKVGGSPGTVAVEVRKRTDGCVLLRTALGLRLDGLAANQVQVQVNYDGRWWPVPVSGGGGTVRTSSTSPAKPSLCKGKEITVRYRVAFLNGARGGRLSVVGEASTAAGRELGRAADEARVVGGAAAVTPSPTPSRKPSPTATPSAATTPPGADGGTAAVAALAPTVGSSAAAADSSSGGSPIMWFGIALVLVGVALIVLLVRRNRAEKVDERVGDHPPVPLPRSAGTTYRSGAPTGQVYGQQPATPTVYGGPASPRPTGNVYGASVAGDRPGGEPPAPAAGDATTVLPRPPR
ncbi:hypothetical protein ONA91_09505 [Micromonospora sp. DR5-3]|uniref:hypothetical protein n=1 Tax=unclassified Micromonospora TaxID=2617518 RepID=UPI0011D54B85|nr:MULTISPECIES: hypothetical protein [unclassified Micromonospora]MCW3814690.1 hypothetical protein [Micromonospora sp. DR5-3]TYC23481.1 hypothetical protein FXF52_14950 [Micromonospora sp. MP36]